MFKLYDYYYSSHTTLNSFLSNVVNRADVGSNDATTPVTNIKQELWFNHCSVMDAYVMVVAFYSEGYWTVFFLI